MNVDALCVSSTVTSQCIVGCEGAGRAPERASRGRDALQIEYPAHVFATLSQRSKIHFISCY